MLTTILSTPRTGSSTFSNEVGLSWFPSCHPNKNNREYFNFLHCDTPEQVTEYCDRYIGLLEEKVLKDDQDIVIKILISHLEHQPHILDRVLAISSKIYHTVRYNYQDHLKSYTSSRLSGEWGASRKREQISVCNNTVSLFHTHLTAQLKMHSDLYHLVGGDLVVLEERTQNRYPQVPVFNNNIIWPSFDTEAQFKKR